MEILLNEKLQNTENKDQELSAARFQRFAGAVEHVAW
jgi:hypothetical protein